MKDKESQFLLIDAGNSYIKAAVFEGDTITERFGTSVIEEKNLTFFLAGKTFYAAIVLNSGPADLNMSWDECVPSGKVFDMNSGLTDSINWAYEKPENLGKDKIAALVGAQKLFPEKNICVVQTGTCLTIDCLDKNKKHWGGTISPGLKMRLKSLHEFTAKLPLTSEKEAFGPLGNSTVSCIASGALYGMIGEIEYQYGLIKSRFESETVLVLTGGDVNNLARLLKPSNFVVSDLVFFGMMKVLKDKI